MSGSFNRHARHSSTGGGSTHVPSETSGKNTLVQQPMPRTTHELAGVPLQLRATEHGAPEPDRPGAGHAAVQQLAAAGVAAGGSALPHGETIQRLFGRHNISDIKAHIGEQAGDASRAIGAEAYATGNHVAFTGAPSLHTAAHEAAHVVQQRSGVQLKAGVGETGDLYERHANIVADAVVARHSAEDLLDGGGATHRALPAVQRKDSASDAKVLDNQAHLKGTDVEIPVLEGALLATRKEAVKRGLLSQTSFDAGLALSQAMTQLQPVVAASSAIDKGLQERAAMAAQQLFDSLQRETADDKNFQIAPTMGESTAVTSQNPYTDEVKVTTSFLVWSKTRSMGSWFEQLPGLIRQGRWSDVFQGYRRMLDGLDLWVADQLRRKGVGTPEESLGNAHQHHAQLRTGLEQIADKHASRLPALFHPDPKTVATEKSADRPAADTVPMNVYFWKDDKDGRYHLYDLTTPSRPTEQVISGPPTTAMLNTFFDEVARYPEGEVRYTLPGSVGGVAETSGKIKWYEWIGYAGMAVAAVGLAFLSAGASVPATVCFATGAIAGGLSAGGHLVDTERLGTATSATVVLDVAQIAASFASFGAMSLTLKAGGAAAALASSRWFVPLVGAAAGADVVQMVALTDITFMELNKIQNGAGTLEDKQRAMAVLLTQLVVVSGLTVLSVQGARNARSLSGKPLEIVDQNGKNVLRLVGETAPSSAGESAPAANATRAPIHDVGTNEHAPGPVKQPPPTHGPVPHEPKAPADHAIEIVKRHKGSIREALGELNRQGFAQAQMREALEAAWRSTGRDTAGTLIAQDGTLILLSRRVGPNQPVNLIRPNGVAEFGRGELFIDPKNLQSPIGVRNVWTGDGTPLLMPGETTPASSSAAQATKAATELGASAPERIEQLARAPGHGGRSPSGRAGNPRP